MTGTDRDIRPNLQHIERQKAARRSLLSDYSLAAHLLVMGKKEPGDLGKRGLEIGSGENRRFATEAAQQGVTVDTVNPHEVAQRLIVPDLSLPGVNYWGYAHNLPMETGKYSTVVMHRVLQFLLPADILLALHEIVRVLEPGGKGYILPLDRVEKEQLGALLLSTSFNPKFEEITHDQEERAYGAVNPEITYSRLVLTK